MAELDEIVQKVSISGQENVYSAFKSIADSAKSAFDAIKTASAGEIFGGIAAGIAVAVTALGDMVLHASEATHQLELLANEAGATVEQMSALQAVFARAGADTDGMANAFKRLAVRAQTDFPEIQKNVRDAADNTRAAYTKIQESTLAVAAAQLKMATDSTAAAQQVVTNQFAIVGADLALAEAQNNLNQVMNQTNNSALSIAQAEDKLRVAMGGVHDKTLDVRAAEENLSAIRKKASQDYETQALNEQKAILAVSEAEQKATAVRIKSAEDAQKATLQRQQDIINLAKAEEEQARSEKAAADLALKDIGAIAAAFRETGKVMEGVAIPDLLKAIEHNANLAAGAAKGLTTAIPASGLQVFYELADAFSKIKDEAQRTALGVAAMGRGFRVDMIEAAKSGKESVTALTQALIENGQVIGEDQVKPLSDFDKAWKTLGETWSVIVTKVSALLAPFFTWLVNKLNEFGVGLLYLGSVAGDWSKKTVEAVTYVIEKWKELVSWINKVLDAMSRLVGIDPHPPGPDATSHDEVPSNDSGGLFRGRPGRDTNLSWLTDREFVMRTAAVDHWGEAFMHAVNNMAPLPAFETGGLVAQLARPAGGSSASPGRPLNLTIGGQTFKNLTAPENVAKALMKFAVLDQISTTGKKPGWVR